MPVKTAKITSPYGMRILQGRSVMHDGIDMISASGDNTVYAITDGVVTSDFDQYNHKLAFSDRKHSGGNMIIIRHNIHGTDYYCRYLHLINNTVSIGQIVKAGDVIGRYGNVGYSYGAHLHFDAYTMAWTKIDPTNIVNMFEQH